MPYDIGNNNIALPPVENYRPNQSAISLGQVLGNLVRPESPEDELRKQQAALAVQEVLKAKRENAGAASLGDSLSGIPSLPPGYVAALNAGRAGQDAANIGRAVTMYGNPTEQQGKAAMAAAGQTFTPYESTTDSGQRQGENRKISDELTVSAAKPAGENEVRGKYLDQNFNNLDKLTPQQQKVLGALPSATDGGINGGVPPSEAVRNDKPFNQINDLNAAENGTGWGSFVKSGFGGTIGNVFVPGMVKENNINTRALSGLNTDLKGLNRLYSKGGNSTAADKAQEMANRVAPSAHIPPELMHDNIMGVGANLNEQYDEALVNYDAAVTKHDKDKWHDIATEIRRIVQTNGFDSFMAGKPTKASVPSAVPAQPIHPEQGSSSGGEGNTSGGAQDPAVQQKIDQARYMKSQGVPESEILDALRKDGITVNGGL